MVFSKATCQTLAKTFEQYSMIQKIQFSRIEGSKLSLSVWLTPAYLINQALYQAQL